MNPPRPIPELSPRNTRKLLGSRRSQAVGGVLLAASFFMPAVQACNAPVVPANDVYQFLRKPTANLDEWLMVFPVYTAAYLFGLLTCIVVLRLRSSTGPVNSTIGRSISLVSGATAIAFAILLVTEWSASSLTRFPDVIITAFLLAFVVYWLRTVRKGPPGRLCLRWCSAVYCTLWFGMYMIEGGTTYYGLWLSLGASILITAASFVEARILTGRSLLATLGGLLIGRLTFVDYGGPHCRTCGYVLVGLTSNRCPECGTPFSDG